MKLKRDELDKLTSHEMIELVLSLQGQSNTSESRSEEQTLPRQIDLQYLRSTPIRWLIMTIMGVGFLLMYYSVWRISVTRLAGQGYFGTGLLLLGLNWVALELHKAKKIQLSAMPMLGSLIFMTNAALFLPNAWESFVPYMAIPIVAISGALIMPKVTWYVAFITLSTNLITVIFINGFHGEILSYFMMPAMFSLIVALMVTLITENLLGAFNWVIQSEYKARQRGDELFAIQQLLRQGQLETQTALKVAEEAKEIAEVATKQTLTALHETDSLFKAARAILGATNLVTISHALISQFNELIVADDMSFYLIDYEQHRVILALKANVLATKDEVTYSELEAGIAGMVFQSKQPIISHHADDGIEPEATKEIRKIRGVGPLIVAPLVTQGEVIGIITAVRNVGQAEFTQHEVDLLMALTTQAAAAIKNIRLFQAAQEAREAAEKANKAKSVFLANMSHELRTPLNAVLGFSHLMQRDELVTVSQAEKLHIINRSGEHLLSLINDVLDISKIEAGKMGLHESEFNLHHLLRDIEAMFRLRVQEKGLTLQVERAANVPASLIADVGKLRQILINLLGNAVKFTSSGGVTLRVSVAETTQLFKTFDTSEWLHVEVEDTGYGISEAELGQLFEAFVQTESGRNSQQGTGLGLVLSRQFVRLMGGDLTATSEIGVGSCFEFDLKVRVLEPVEATPSEESRRVIGLANGPYRVLVVDDKADNRVLLREMLSPLGFEIQEAENGLAALAVWEAWQPHYVLLDIRMPVMDGYETARQLRLRTPPSLPPLIQGGARGGCIIIAVTASAFEEERAEVLGVGCDDFIRKPIREGGLLELMARHGGVVYRYAEAARERVVESEAVVSAVAIPSELLTLLHEAAMAGSYSQLIELATVIKGFDERAGLQLLQWIDAFDYDTILAWEG